MLCFFKENKNLTILLNNIYTNITKKIKKRDLATIISCVLSHFYTGHHVVIPRVIFLSADNSDIF